MKFLLKISLLLFSAVCYSGCTVKVTDPNIYYARGYEAMNHFNYTGAIFYFTKALELNPDYKDAYFDRSTVYWNLSMQKEAFTDINRYIELDDTDYSAYYQRSSMYEFNGQLNEALNDIEKVITLNQFITDGFVMRGRIYVRMKRYSLAINDWEHTIFLEPDFEGILRGKINEVKELLAKKTK